MANSIDDFLSKASPEQKEKFEALVKDAASVKPMNESERIAKQAKETNDISQKNDPTKGQVQTPKEGNAVDKVLSEQGKEGAKEAGQTLVRQGVTPDKER